MALAPKPMQRKLAIGVAVMGTFLSALAIDHLVGQPGRMVDLITLFAAAFGAGAALVLAIRGPR